MNDDEEKISIADVIRNAKKEYGRRFGSYPDRLKMLAAVPDFKKSVFGSKYKKHHPDSILRLKSFQSFFNHGNYQR